MNELAEVISCPKVVFEGMAATAADSFEKGWQKFQMRMQTGILEDRFQAGRSFGKLFLNILELMSGIGLSVKINKESTTKLPRLIELTKALGPKTITKMRYRHTISSTGSGSTRHPYANPQTRIEFRPDVVKKKSHSENVDDEIDGMNEKKQTGDR